MTEKKGRRGGSITANIDQRLLDPLWSKKVDLQQAMMRLFSFGTVTPAGFYLHRRLMEMPVEEALQLLPAIKQVLEGKEPGEVYLNQRGGHLPLFFRYRSYYGRHPGEPEVRNQPFLFTHFSSSRRPIDVRYEGAKHGFITSPSLDLPVLVPRYGLRFARWASMGHLFAFERAKEPEAYDLYIPTLSDGSRRFVHEEGVRLPTGRG